MATFSNCNLSAPLHFLILFCIAFIPNSALSFSFDTFQKNPNFDSEIALFGDAKISNDSIKLTNPSAASSSGLLIYKKPIKFLQPNPKTPVSFSTQFSFSISQGNGDGLAFLIVLRDFSSKFPGKSLFGIPGECRFLGIEFDTSTDGNHVRVNAGSLVSSRVSNVSSINLVLNSGKKMHSWIDYDASSKRLEIRLAEFGNARPYNPLLAYLTDLSEMWKDEEVFLGISSSSGKSVQTSSVYSWSFGVREVPSRMHSQPVDPQVYSKKKGVSETRLGDRKKSICPLSILAGLIFATGCGTLVTFLVLFIWVVFVGRHRMVPELPVTGADFKYEIINTVDQKDIKDDAKG